MTDFDISITSYCNAACPSCKRYPDFGDPYIDPNQKLHQNLNQVHMDFDMFKKVIENNLKNFYDKNVSYEGELGDPLVHPKIKSFINYGCKIFNKLLVVTNGGNRRAVFYQDLGNTYSNLEMIFSIDGLHDDTNNIYRKKVNTEKAKNNMLSFSKTLYGKEKTYWQFLVFEHNFFEIPEVLELSEKYKIKVYIKINQRPKYDNNKTKFSEFVLAN